jgi:hypothetical protein
MRQKNAGSINLPEAKPGITVQAEAKAILWRFISALRGSCTLVLGNSRMSCLRTWRETSRNDHTWKVSSYTYAYQRRHS